MSYRKFQVYFFVTCMALSTALSLWVFWPYLVLLAFGGVLAILARPVYLKFLSWIRSDVAAAFLTVVTVAVAVLLPIGFFIAALSSELIGAIGDIKAMVDGDSVLRALTNILPASMQDQVPVIMNEGLRVVRAIAEALSQGLVGVFSNIFGVVFGFLVVLISLYYLLKDGAKVKRELLLLSPLGDEYDQLMFDRIVVAVRAVMGGMLVLGLLKGVLASVTFWVFGIHAPLFWGTMTGFCSLVPMFGTALITMPAVAYLLITGHVGAAIGLAIVSFGIIGTVDNFLQPKIVQSKTNIHPLLILLAILGGLQLYGFAGFVLGPLTVAVTIALIDIYKKEFKVYVEKAGE